MSSPGSSSYRRPFTPTHTLAVTYVTQRHVGDSIRTARTIRNLPVQLTGWHAFQDPQRVEYVTEHGDYFESKWTCVDDLTPLPIVNTSPCPYALPLKEMTLQLHTARIKVQQLAATAAQGAAAGNKTVRVESPSGRAS